VNQRRTPVVFVSSTIYDLRDVRNALRFWLKSAGCDVSMSEFNDMDRPPDANAFNACFESVRNSDFYILLVGERMGADYSVAPDGTKVSVTQQEYRVAYESFLTTGRPIIVNLARSEVKQSIEAWIRAGRPDPVPYGGLAPRIEAFLGEIGRSDESDTAVQGLGPYPLANWISGFSTFEDIIDAIKGPLALRWDIELQKITASIRLEIENTLCWFIRKVQVPVSEDRIPSLVEEMMERDPRFTPDILEASLRQYEAEAPVGLHQGFDQVYRAMPILDLTRPVSLTPDQAVIVGMYSMIGTVAVERIPLLAVRRAVAEGLLLTYDPASRTFVSSLLNDALVDLLRDVTMYTSRIAGLASVRSRTDEALAPPMRGQAASLTALDANQIWGTYLVQANIYKRLWAILRYTSGVQDTPLPEALLPSSPRGDEVEQALLRERATAQDVRTWMQRGFDRILDPSNETNMSE
jgi:hypothetical protein